MSALDDQRLFRKTIDRMYLDSIVPAWQSTLENTKTNEIKEIITKTFLNICLLIPTVRA